MKISIIISLVVFVSFFYFVSVESLSCGRVFEGPNRGSDRRYQHSKDTVLANWQDFGDDDKIEYAYALISQNITTRAIEESGWDAPEDKRCRSSSGLTREADLVDFRFGEVGHETSAIITDQRLHTGMTYYVIIRAKEGSRTIYSNSNGIEVIQDDDDDDLEPYEQGLIAMGCAIFCLLCLCLLLLLLLLLAKGKSDDKYTTTVHRNENVEKV
jgi:hypothetical protein